uniref:Lipoprotein n=1 Tax=Wuchereria bancrofti TaxID=6293 RepID=A0AAF5Q747_WUCBA
MSKLIVYLVFIIYCCNQQPNVGGGGAGAAAGGVAGIYISFKILKVSTSSVILIKKSLASISAAEVVTDYKADKLWDNNLLMETTQIQESTLTNCDTMENGRLFILAEKPLLLTTNTLNLIK